MKQFRNELSTLRLRIDFKTLIIFATVIALSAMVVWDLSALSLQAPHLATGYMQAIAAAATTGSIVTWLTKQM